VSQNATAYIAGNLLLSEEWYSFFYDRSTSLIQSSEDWHAWFYDRSPIETLLVSSIEPITASSSTETIIEGITLESNISEVQAIGSQNVLIEISGIDLLAAISEINANGFSIYVLSGLSLTSVLGEISQVASGVINLSGEELLSAAEEITAQTDNSASVSINGINLSSQLGFVSASGTGEMQMVPGRVSYQLPKLNARTRIDGLILQSQASDLLASGTIIINNTAKIMSIEAVLNLKKIQANGVWDIEENDLILLLAA
jgi:hypothetical protein